MQQGSTGNVEVIVRLAQQLADETNDFFTLKGPGLGDRATGAFMADLRAMVCKTVGNDCWEKRICGDNNLAVDFFLPDEQTIIEVALSLRNPGSEFERDILKALMAQECGYPVKRLLFLSKPGALHRHSQPSTKAIVSWVRGRHGLSVEIHELRDGLAL